MLFNVSFIPDENEFGYWLLLLYPCFEFFLFFLPLLLLLLGNNGYIVSASVVNFALNSFGYPFNFISHSII